LSTPTAAAEIDAIAEIAEPAADSAEIKEPAENDEPAAASNQPVFIEH